MNLTSPIRFSCEINQQNDQEVASEDLYQTSNQQRLSTKQQTRKMNQEAENLKLECKTLNTEFNMVRSLMDIHPREGKVLHFY